MTERSFFARPQLGIQFEECHFYHVMDIPGHGVTSGDWDLRGKVDEYLGQIGLHGKKVLEIGPASGFLTFEMEKKGASVVSVEVTENPGWDFVPYPAAVMDPVFGPRKEEMRRLKNSYWFAHRANSSKAEIYYGDACNLPAVLGDFDVAVMAAVLLHCQNPTKIVEQCAKHASTLVITDMFFPELEGRPVCQLVPSEENRQWDTWWHFSSDFFIQFCKVLGFAEIKVTTHTQHHRNTPYPFFTVVASR